MEPQVKEAVDKQREFIKTYLEGTGSLERAGAAQTYIYDCTASLAGIGGNYLAVEFKRNGARFALFEGGFGPGVGAYTGWGSAIFNQPIENVMGQTCPFTIEIIGILGGTCHVQITNFNNFIGYIPTSGIGIGGGVGAGGGTFKQAS
jgi:hypothetical protein